MSIVPTSCDIPNIRRNIATITRAINTMRSKTRTTEGLTYTCIRITPDVSADANNVAEQTIQVCKMIACQGLGRPCAHVRFTKLPGDVVAEYIRVAKSKPDFETCAANHAARVDKIVADFNELRNATGAENAENPYNVSFEIRAWWQARVDVQQGVVAWCDTAGRDYALFAAHKLWIEMTEAADVVEYMQLADKDKVAGLNLSVSVDTRNAIDLAYNVLYYFYDEQQNGGRA